MKKTSKQDNPTHAMSVLTDSGGNDGLCFEVHRLTSGPGQGVEQVTLRCGQKKITILPTRGMGIWKGENIGIPFGWDSPIAGPVHPKLVPLSDPSGLGWLDGFDEMMVRCGMASNGAPEFDHRGGLAWPLHGRIANIPASEFRIAIDESAGKIAIHGIVNESRFHFRRLQLQTEISLRFDSDEISIVDRIINLSGRPASIQMLYHNNFGPPILESGSELHAPVKKLVPRNSHSASGLDRWNQMGPPEPGFEEQVYFLELAADERGESTVLLTNADRAQGVSIRYDSIALPCFTVWKNLVSQDDGYVTGLEPATNFPNTRRFEEANGRVVGLAPGQSYDMSFHIGLLVDAASVGNAIEAVDRLKVESADFILEPTAEWCE